MVSLPLFRINKLRLNYYFLFMFFLIAEFDRTDPAEFQRLMQVNYLGSVYPTRCVVPHMKDKKDGRIIFVASQVAQVNE